jgi:hypothetical protein
MAHTKCKDLGKKTIEILTEEFKFEETFEINTKLR